jgi:hypothetical protein
MSARLFAFALLMTLSVAAPTFAQEPDWSAAS